MSVKQFKIGFQVFMKHSHNKPIRKMLDMVNESLQNQVAVDDNGLRLKQCSEYHVSKATVPYK